MQAPFIFGVLSSIFQLIEETSFYFVQPVPTCVPEQLSSLFQAAEPKYQDEGGGYVRMYSCYPMLKYISFLTKTNCCPVQMVIKFHVCKTLQKDGQRCMSKTAGVSETRGQQGMKKRRRHQRHGFPPVHLSTLNKQSSHQPGSSCYVLASKLGGLLIYMCSHTSTHSRKYKESFKSVQNCTCGIFLNGRISSASGSMHIIRLTRGSPSLV